MWGYVSKMPLKKIDTVAEKRKVHRESTSKGVGGVYDHGVK